MVRTEGLEPPTLWFEARCSIQLSYVRRVDFVILATFGLRSLGDSSPYREVRLVVATPCTEIDLK